MDAVVRVRFTKIIAETLVKNFGFTLKIIKNQTIKNINYLGRIWGTSENLAKWKIENFCEMLKDNFRNSQDALKKYEKI